VVPTLHYQNEAIDEVMSESGPIIDFLTDVYPSHLVPKNLHIPTAAIQRYRQRYFVERFFAKVSPGLFSMMPMAEEQARAVKAESIMDALSKDIEPLLANADPFFDGSPRLTIVEVGDL
jgi:glutathione S-transferase